MLLVVELDVLLVVGLEVELVVLLVVGLDAELVVSLVVGLDVELVVSLVVPFSNFSVVWTVFSDDVFGIGYLVNGVVGPLLAVVLVPRVGNFVGFVSIPDEVSLTKKN